MFEFSLFFKVQLKSRPPFTALWDDAPLRRHSSNEILPFAITCNELESIMLSEISQRKTNIIWFHLYVESEKKTKEQINKKQTD